VALRNVEQDRAGFERDKVAFLMGRDLPERLKRAICGCLHLAERHKANFVRLAHFFERPADTHIARLPLPRSGDRSNAVMMGIMESSG
jgi:hypothetical protein